ncbi:MBOAT family protein [bacterium]|nr:MBOAT family protein [bacterium]
MVFSSPIFLFGFLPLALLCYYLVQGRAKNIFLLSVSLLFYAWGEVFYIGVMLLSIVANYVVGRLIDQVGDVPALAGRKKLYLSLGVVINLALLVTFKYANFIVDNINTLLHFVALPAVDLVPIHLPLGISFFTFQALSYIVDVYRKEAVVQKNVFDLALYISLFPQLIAGPIVRYHDIDQQIKQRTYSIELFASGAQRFTFGLAKKLLIANPLGEVADNAFALSQGELTMPLAWIGILAYTFQIYFDFSGYSDMAIGLGRMFGFRFLENFNYPYIAKSLREFWRRWHISLSTWFRDYVYIPLGGNRKGSVRTYVNLFTVFLLTGVWHGASWNFVVWGMFHGVFLAAEHRGFSRVLERLWVPLQHAYLLLVVVVSWVLFRADSLSEAVAYISTMFDISRWGDGLPQYEQLISAETPTIFMIAAILSLPIYPWLSQKINAISFGNTVLNGMFIASPRIILFVVLLLLCAMKVATSTYNPFIYFRF